MENIQVALRMRPLNRREIQRQEVNVWQIQNNNTIAINPEATKEIAGSKKMLLSTRSSFNFDHCFGFEHDNVSLYRTMVKRVALSSLKGINGTIFMYGQTGSGKTYTMMGYNRNEESHEFDTSVRHSAEKITGSPFMSHRLHPSQERNAPNRSFDYTDIARGNYIITDTTGSTGVLILALKDIFKTIEKDMDKTYFLKCSYMEIYNDLIYDLLQSPDKMHETLSLSEDPKKDFFVKGLTEESVSSIEDILDKLRIGEANRHYARTTMNHSSSRSHAIFRLMVQTVSNGFIRNYRREMQQKHIANINNKELKSMINEDQNTSDIYEGTLITESLLNFVDLAGSEKVSNHHNLTDGHSQSSGNKSGSLPPKEESRQRIEERIKEGQHINKSLFFLTQVISLKSEGKSNTYIPYRNSPLTKILRSSLGGNSRTLIILCINPAFSQFENTISTLRFGQSAKKIENTVSANIITSNDSEAMKILIADYEKKLNDAVNAKTVELSRQAVLFRQTEALQSQKSTLVQKLNQMMKLALSALAYKVPAAELRHLTLDYSENFAHFDKVGILMAVAKERVPGNSRLNRLRLKAQAIDKSRIDDDDDTPNRKNTSIQSSKADNEGKFALAALKISTEKNKLLTRQVELLKSSLNQLVEKNKTSFDLYLYFKDAHELYEQTAIELSQQLNALVEAHTLLCTKYHALRDDYATIKKEHFDLKKKYNLVSKCEGISDISDEELALLEKCFWDNLDKVKTEKAQRRCKQEVQLLKEKLGIAEPINPGSGTIVQDTKDLEEDIPFKITPCKNTTELIESIQKALQEKDQDRKELVTKEYNSTRGMYLQHFENLQRELVVLNSTHQYDDLLKENSIKILQEKPKDIQEVGVQVDAEDSEGAANQLNYLRLEEQIQSLHLSISDFLEHGEENHKQTCLSLQPLAITNLKETKSPSRTIHPTLAIPAADGENHTHRSNETQSHLPNPEEESGGESSRGLLSFRHLARKKAASTLSVDSRSEVLSEKSSARALDPLKGKKLAQIVNKSPLVDKGTQKLQTHHSEKEEKANLLLNMPERLRKHFAEEAEYVVRDPPKENIEMSLDADHNISPKRKKTSHKNHLIQSSDSKLHHEQKAFSVKKSEKKSKKNTAISLKKMPKDLSMSPSHSSLEPSSSEGWLTMEPVSINQPSHRKVSSLSYKKLGLINKANEKENQSITTTLSNTELFNCLVTSSPPYKRYVLDQSTDSPLKKSHIEAVLNNTEIDDKDQKREVNEDESLTMTNADDNKSLLSSTNSKVSLLSNTATSKQKRRSRADRRQSENCDQ